MNGIQVGKKALVTNVGASYSTYADWAGRYNHTGTSYVSGVSIDHGALVDVEVIAKHGSFPREIICGVTYKGQFWMIGIDGLTPADNLRELPVSDALSAYRTGSAVWVNSNGSMRLLDDQLTVDEVLDGVFYVEDAEEAAE